MRVSLGALLLLFWWTMLLAPTLLDSGLFEIAVTAGEGAAVCLGVEERCHLLAVVAPQGVVDSIQDA